MKRFTETDKITANGFNAGDVENVDEAHVKLCEIWIRMCLQKQKTINKNLGSSYTLKHKVENFGKCLYHDKVKLKEIGYVTYVTNGAFIKAMKNLGYYYSSPHGTINPYFNARYVGPMKVDKNLLKDVPHHENDWDIFLTPLLSAIEKQSSST